MTTIGILGAGHIGSQLARAAIANGYAVVISNSRGPETLAELIEELGPGATAETSAGAAAAGDFVVVTIPLNRIDTLPVAELAGKVVIDTNNYYWERDGHIEALDNGTETVSGLLQAKLPTSIVAKGFNHIYAADILKDASPAGTPGRRALATASNSDEGIARATQTFDDFGFDTVSAGPLSESWRAERDQPAYGPRFDADELRAALAAAKPITEA